VLQMPKAPKAVSSLDVLLNDLRVGTIVRTPSDLTRSVSTTPTVLSAPFPSSAFLSRQRSPRRRMGCGSVLYLVGMGSGSGPGSGAGPGGVGGSGSGTGRGGFAMRIGGTRTSSRFGSGNSPGSRSGSGSSSGLRCGEGSGLGMSSSGIGLFGPGISRVPRWQSTKKPVISRIVPLETGLR
jgi:hypothetical protein